MKDILRDRKFLVFLSGSIIFIILYLISFVFPTLNRIKSLKTSEITQKEKELQEMQALKEEYLSIRKQYSTDSTLSKDGESIFSLVERIAKSKGLAANISSIKPIVSSVKEKEDLRETGVEVKMKELTMQNLVSYLFTIENPPYNLNIKEIQINSPKDSSYLEVIFMAYRWEKK